MKIKLVIYILFIINIFYSCSTSKIAYNPHKKYPKYQLQQDYILLKNILEKKHPSLYWYTSKDSMDEYFKLYYTSITDSMTESQFGWKVLAPLISKIRCGHTSFGMSKNYNKWITNKKYPSFPLYLKVWKDSMVVTGNLHKRDTILKRGTVIKSINGLNINQLVSILFDYMPADGNANNLNYIRLSSNFPFYHRQIFGLSKNYIVQYIDIVGTQQAVSIPLYEPPKDTGKTVKRTTASTKSKKEIKKEVLLSKRSISIDTATHSAILTINTFSSGKLRKFLRQSFRKIRKEKIQQVVLDLRSNGGGRISLSTLLTKYVSRKGFKIADTSFAVTKTLKPYGKYFKDRFINNLALFFSTKKRKDGLYHFGYWERKWYKPKKTNHFGGDLYILTNGPTFSASTLFCNAMKGQPDVMLVGEETGGGWYGNNGILIPDITLPYTRLRVRIPLFRLVQYNHISKKGSGITPDIYVGTSYEALKKGEDKKMQVVLDLIKQKKNMVLK